MTAHRRFREDSEPESSILEGGKRYRIQFVPVGASWRYDITGPDAQVVAELVRTHECTGLPWRASSVREGVERALVERIVQKAWAQKLVTGHTGRARGRLLEVERGFVTVALETGTEVSLPCTGVDAEAACARAIAEGTPHVAVDLRDGVPLRLELDPSRPAPSYPPPPASEKRLKPE